MVAEKAFGMSAAATVVCFLLWHFGRRIIVWGSDVGFGTGVSAVSFSTAFQAEGSLL